MKCPCCCQRLDIWRAFNLAWHVIPRRTLCLDLQRWSCLIGFQLCLLATCSVLPCSWCASWGEHKQHSWETTHAVSKKKEKKKSLKCSSPILWEFHMETEHNKRINHINYYFCGKPSLFPDAFSSAIFHCNSLPLTKVSGSLQGLACSWPFWMLPSCRKGVPGPPYLCFAVTKRQL